MSEEVKEEKKVVQFNNLQDDIVYHANIFNYDKKFLSDLLRYGLKIDFSQYLKEKKVKPEDINLVIDFLKTKAKDQVELMTIAVDHEYGRLTEEDAEIIAQLFPPTRKPLLPTLYR